MTNEMVSFLIGFAAAAVGEAIVAGLVAWWRYAHREEPVQTWQVIGGGWRQI